MVTCPYRPVASLLAFAFPTPQEPKLPLIRAIAAEAVS
jgi:hypothetical protein